MRTTSIYTLFFLLIALTTSAQKNEAYPDGIPFEIGHFDQDSLGNHRAVIQVEKKETAVWVDLPWRRQDNPEEKGIIVTNKAGKAVHNFCLLNASQETGNLLFEPTHGKGIYYVYYLPHLTSGSPYYPTVNYIQQNKEQQKEWLRSLNFADSQSIEKSKFTVAKTLRFESQSTFDQFYPMEVIATQTEVEEMLKVHPNPYLVFVEDRKHPIRMQHHVPHKWIKDGTPKVFQGKALKGEYFTFQLGVFAAREQLENVEVEFSSLKGEHGELPATALTSLNTEGIGWTGEAFTKKVDVAQGDVQAFWIGVDLPADIAPGSYTAQLKIKPKQFPKQTVLLELEVEDQLIVNRGDDDPYRLTRLRWFNSQMGADNRPVAPFSSIDSEDRSLSILGRRVQLNGMGWPQKIESYFTEDVTAIGTKATQVLTSPMHLEVLQNGKALKWFGKAFHFEEQAAGKVSWKAENEVQGLRMHLSGSLEYDGFLSYTVELEALEDMEIDDMSLNIPYTSDASRYMLGLGKEGGYAKSEYDWKWDVTKHQEGAWFGGIQAGLQYTLRDENYKRPLNTNFYQSQPLILPDFWYNQGKGGIKASDSEAGKTVRNYTGKRSLKAGDRLQFQVNLLITPFKPITVERQWSTRFLHKFLPVEEAAQTGATVINVHHGNEVNPYINYPFIHQEQMRTYIEKAHALGMKVKVYNTIRELSYQCPELFVLKSFGDEILTASKGGGYAWLQEHLVGDYKAAWFTTATSDAAVLNNGMSRWHNYYIEGLNWLAKEMEIDGIYLDDLAFDRTTMKRARTVLDAHRKDVIIDLHSCNQFNHNDGFTNSAYLYMDHFPYVDRLWFGEVFDYNKPDDFWLVEVSGIPFGLMGETMAEGHPFRGMLYGMSNRLYGKKHTPKALWKLWDDFGIEQSKMKGYWLEKTPVTVLNDKLKVTSYVLEDKVLLAVGSWSDKDEEVMLDIDWDQLQFSADNAQFIFPEVEGIQAARTAQQIDAKVKVPAGEGVFIILK